MRRVETPRTGQAPTAGAVVALEAAAFVRGQVRCTAPERGERGEVSRRLDWVVPPARAVEGEVRVPGDKSISHRVAMLGAIAHGRTEVSGFLEAEDTRATLRAVQALGVAVESDGAGSLRIRGAGRNGLRRPASPLDLGNSGTGLRLLTGLLAGQAFDSTLVGDDSLSRRPMRRIAGPLTRMGARVATSPDGTPPLAIWGGQRLVGADHRLTVPSAQVKSCLLLAGLYAAGRTRVEEPAPTRDHTERMLAGFGYDVERGRGQVALAGGGELAARMVAVPGDLSSAAFFLVGACIARRGRIRVPGVGVNPTRDGVLRILERMGAEVVVESRRDSGGEPVAALAAGASRLRGVEIGSDLAALGIDEIPVLLLAAACAEGVTVLRGAGELRVKESDRLAAMEEGLRRLGVRVEARPDGMVVHGRDAPFPAARVESRGDHRIAMTFALAGLRAEGPVEIRDCANVATSFPRFTAEAQAAGLAIEERRA